MKDDIMRALRIIFRIFIALIFSVIIIVVTAEKKAHRNLFINVSKRIAAEAGRFIAPIFIKEDGIGLSDFGPRIDSADGESGEGALAKNIPDILGTGVSMRILRNFTISGYARGFDYENFTNNDLKKLRQDYALEALVSGSGSELEKVIILRNWVRKVVTRGVPGNVDYNFNALDILERAKKGEKFFCSEYATVFVQCALSLGITGRYVGLFKGHVVSEVWSNQFAKWVLMDVDNDLYYEKDGLPLNALELHRIWEKKDFSGLKALRGLASAEVDSKTAENLLSYYHEFYVRMRNDWFSHRYPHWYPKSNSIMNGLEWKDAFTADNILVARQTTEDEAMYFPINITSIGLRKGGNGKIIPLYLATFTPGFLHFNICVDGGIPAPSMNNLYGWEIHKGVNKISVRAVNLLGVEGAASEIELVVN